MYVHMGSVLCVPGHVHTQTHTEPFACTYSPPYLVKHADTLAHMHAQKHKSLSHAGIRADLRAAGMPVSLNLHIGFFFFMFSSLLASFQQGATEAFD